jgi:hypothetical protein
MGYPHDSDSSLDMKLKKLAFMYLSWLQMKTAADACVVYDVKRGKWAKMTQV